MIQLDNIHISLGDLTLFNGFNLNVQSGEILGVLGPSGCGKTTLLRTIAGFQSIQGGHITLGERTLNNGHMMLAPEKREIGMVFQDHALFPHLSVADNIGFGLHKWSKSDKKARITELLNLIQLDNLGERFPHELSGGQQQRVALARALAPKPKLILLDEPFSNLDCALRHDLVKHTRDLLKKEHTAAILVTHDIQDAEGLCDRYGHLNDGQIMFHSRDAA